MFLLPDVPDYLTDYLLCSLYQSSFDQIHKYSFINIITLTEIQTNRRNK